MTIYDDDDMGDGIYGAGDDDDEDNGNGNNDDEFGLGSFPPPKLLADSPWSTKIQSGISPESRSRQSFLRAEANSLDVCVCRIRRLLLLPLIVIVLDLMDTELLRDAARARVFKGQARVVLRSRGDEDVRNALV